MDISDLTHVYYSKLSEANLDFRSPYIQALERAILDILFEERYYSEKDMDYQAKINMALITRFWPQLQEEFGSDITDIFEMISTLREEQQKKTPGLWQIYGAGN